MQHFASNTDLVSITLYQKSIVCVKKKLPEHLTLADNATKKNQLHSSGFFQTIVFGQ